MKEIYATAKNNKENIIKTAKEIINWEKKPFMEDKKKWNKFIMMLFVVADEELKNDFSKMFLQKLKDEKQKDRTDNKLIFLDRSVKEAKSDKRYRDEIVHYEPFKAYEKINKIKLSWIYHIFIAIPYIADWVNKYWYWIYIDESDWELYQTFDKKNNYEDMF